MSAVRAKEGTPPPIIGKAGNYTVFITPPITPKPSSGSPRTPKTPSFSVDLTQSSNLSSSSPKFTPVEKVEFAPSSDLSGSKLPPSPSPPVQVPPHQFEKMNGKEKYSSCRGSSTFGFFWNAVYKVQEVHSSLDDYLANWFGLNQSKYQWALNDYHETKGMDKLGKPKEHVADKGSV